MLVDVPEYVEHKGPIYSIACHPSGQRFATCGSDNKIKIWSLKPLLSARESDLESAPRQLATLTDSISPVNVVRFSHCGRWLASGSDDKVVLLYELKGGKAVAAFGSSDGPNLENWRVGKHMRGHDGQVNDLAWAPDDALLASCSIDNSIIIWDPASGQRVRTLQAHKSFVKGLAWDPVGTYLASAADDKCVIIWRTDGWQPVATITAPFRHGFSTSTFFLRLDWAPLGSSLGVCNSFNSPCHVSGQLARDQWHARANNLVGHTSTVVVVKYNPRVFRPPKKGGAAGEFDDQKAVDVIALGSQDNRVSVWRTDESRAVCVSTRFFTQTAIDLAWTPDGYTLLACSTDGRVALFRFEEHELGQAFTLEQQADLMNEAYGDTRVRNTLFAETADQLQLEAAAAAASDLAKAADPLPTVADAALDARIQPQHGQASRLGASNGTANGPRRINPQPVIMAGGAHLGDLPPPSGSRPGPAGGNSFTFATPTAGPQASAAAPPPRPLQLANGVTEGAPGPAGNTAPASGAKRKAGPQAEGPGGARAPKRVAPERVPTVPDASTPASLGGTPRARLGTPVQGVSGAAQDALQPQPLMSALPVVQQAGPAGGAPAAAVAAAGAQGSMAHHCEQSLALLQVAAQLGRDAKTLQATNNLQPGMPPRAVLSCSSGARVLWRDQVAGHVSLLAGSPHFAACARADGTLQVYTAGGRCMLPPLKLGSAIRFLTADSGWRLLAVTVAGDVRVLDLQALSSTLDTSLTPLLSGALAGTQVTQVRLSSCGAPVVVLSTQAAYIFHCGLRCWACLADNSFPTSAYSSMLPSQGSSTGELGRLQAEAAGAHSGMHSVKATLQAGPRRAVVESRGHLEANMASALALQSPSEWRRWLLSYAHHLAGEADEGRLREVCEDLLGPARPVGEAETAANPQGWQPTVLGLDKRALLRDEVLPAVSRNRANQRLVAEFKELLDQALQSEDEVLVDVDS